MMDLEYHDETVSAPSRESKNSDYMDATALYKLNGTIEWTLYADTDTVNGTESSDAYVGVVVTGWIVLAGMLPVSSLGLLGNAVSMYVWCGDMRSNITSMLFMFLAFTDSCYLVTICMYYIDLQITQTFVLVRSAFFVLLTDIPLLLSSHLTLIVAVTRWYAVWKPLKVKLVMTRCRVLVTCLLTSAWCVTLPVSLMTADGWTQLVVVGTVGCITPIITLLCFSFSLLWMTCKSPGDIARHVRPSDLERRRNMSMAVLWICGCNLLAYPVGVSLLYMNGFWCAASDCRMAFNCVGHLLHCINCSVNIVVYLAFASRFRELLWLRTSIKCHRQSY